MNPPPCDCDCDSQTGHPGISPSIDETLEILGHRLRRDVLEYCTTLSDDTTNLDDLADHVVGRNDESGEYTDRRRIVATLHHRHLPLLAEHGVIEFDPRSGDVRYHPDDLVEEWLDRTREAETG